MSRTATVAMAFLVLTRISSASPAAPAAASPSHAALVKRGRYLATVGDCASCHTQPGAGKLPLAGGFPLHAYFGTIYSSNITPDKATGIGNWTADQFYRALHDGIGADGTHLYPAFPYAYFTRISRADSDAIYAYLRTVKPRHYTPPPNQLIFPTNIRFGMTFWNFLFLDQTPWKPDPKKSAQYNRGSFLVNTMGHCGDCHTPKTFLFSEVKSKAFQGQALDGWYAPNLTGSRRTGLGRWSVADIARFLKTGSNRFGRVTGSMQDVVRLSTSRLSDADRFAIATYLKALPAAPEEKFDPPGKATMRIGQAVFVARCSACHRTPGPPAYPALAHNTLVQSRDPMTVLRVILQGSQAAPTAHGPIGFSMPAFPVLSDAQVAGVANYIRNSWGNRAPPVSKGQVSRLRAMLGTRHQSKPL